MPSTPATSWPTPPLSGTAAPPGDPALAQGREARGGRPMRAVQCTRCGEEWPAGDPALRVACPSCQAPPGRQCRRPSGPGCGVHAARDSLAVDVGLLRPCTALTWDGRHAKLPPFPPQPAPPRLACTTAAPAQGVPYCAGHTALAYTEPEAAASTRHDGAG